MGRNSHIANIDKGLAEGATGGALWKDAEKCFANFTEKNLRWSIFLIKLVKKRLQHKCFLWTTVSENTSGGAIDLHLKVFAF